MNNYEYIIASLPVLSEGSAGKVDAGALVAEIRGHLSSRDNALMDLLLEGYGDGTQDAEFYRRALGCSNGFLRRFFEYDLAVRNAKVDYLNRALGRPEGMDKVVLGEEEPDFDGRAEVDAVLNGSDILARERGLDSIRWEKISSLTTFSYFDLDAILGVIAKMGIVERWRALDEETGREMFQELIDETRASYGGVSYNPAQNE